MNKKKIALVIDIPNWAFDIEAKLLKKRLSAYYDIDIFCASDERYHNDFYLILKDTENYDMIHIFFRKLILDMESDSFKSHFSSESEYLEYISKIHTKLSTGIYDHLFIDTDDNIELYKPVFTKYIKMYYTCSKRLENLYQNISEEYGYCKPWGTIHDTFDYSLFLSHKKRTFEGPLVIGWVGNSKWNIKYQDFKGFQTIILPVLEELQKEGLDIKTDFADKNIIFRTNDEMPEYYSGIDICIIASSTEGTPRPLFEAMANGVVVISTDVGIVPEVMGPLGKKCLIGSRITLSDEEIKKNLKNKIIELYYDREALRNISQENISYSKKCDIEDIYLEYKNYFDTFLTTN